MKWKAGTGLLSATILAGSMMAWAADNPYQDIVTRNAFNLKPIPEPAKPGENQPPPTAVDVFLTGISTLGGGKKVLLQITDKAPGKKPEFPPPLVEGDVQGRIEVVSINPDKGEVTIKIDGNEKTLNFDDNAPKPAGGGPAGAVPPPPAGIPNPGAIPMPGVTTASGAAAAVNAGSGRYGVVVGGGAAAAPAAANAARPGVTTPGTVNYGAASTTFGAMPSASASAAGATPTRPIRTTAESYGNVMIGGGGTTSSQSGQAAAASTATMTREQALAHVEFQRNLIDQGVKSGAIPKNAMPPLPPPPGTRTGGLQTPVSQ